MKMIIKVAVILVCILFVMVPEAFTQRTQIRFIPSFVEVLEDGEEFTVACVVEDVLGLRGVDIQIEWNTTYLDYVNHTATVPVENFPHVPPSPYGGILHTPVIQAKDEIDVIHGTYWFAFAGLEETPFLGNGTAFIITFRSKNISLEDQSYFDIIINITSSDLADTQAGVIEHKQINGIVRIPEFHELIVLAFMVSVLIVTLIKKGIFR